jgi:hypothetical protein
VKLLPYLAPVRPSLRRILLPCSPVLDGNWVDQVLPVGGRLVLALQLHPAKGGVQPLSRRTGVGCSWRSDPRLSATPPVYDPFCGGGSIRLEAQRLGLRACRSDPDPIAVLISRAPVEILPKFAGRPPVHPGTIRTSAIAARKDLPKMCASMDSGCGTRRSVTLARIQMCSRTASRSLNLPPICSRWIQATPMATTRCARLFRDYLSDRGAEHLARGLPFDATSQRGRHPADLPGLGPVIEGFGKISWKTPQLAAFVGCSKGTDVPLTLNDGPTARGFARCDPRCAHHARSKIRLRRRIRRGLRKICGAPLQEGTDRANAGKRPPGTAGGCDDPAAPAPQPETKPNRLRRGRVPLQRPFRGRP